MFCSSLARRKGTALHRLVVNAFLVLLFGIEINAVQTRLDESNSYAQHVQSQHQQYKKGPKQRSEQLEQAYGNYNAPYHSLRGNIYNEDSNSNSLGQYLLEGDLPSDKVAYFPIRGPTESAGDSLDDQSLGLIFQKILDSVAVRKIKNYTSEGGENGDQIGMQSSGSNATSGGIGWSPWSLGSSGDDDGGMEEVVNPNQEDDVWRQPQRVQKPAGAWFVELIQILALGGALVASSLCCCMCIAGG